MNSSLVLLEEASVYVYSIQDFLSALTKLLLPPNAHTLCDQKKTQTLHLALSWRRGALHSFVAATTFAKATTTSVLI